MPLSAKLVSTGEKDPFMEKPLGSSKVQPNFRVTLTGEVRKKLGVKVGSLVVFLENERGEVVVKRAELRPV